MKSIKHEESKLKAYYDNKLAFNLPTYKMKN